jgi:hypothetical protein
MGIWDLLGDMTLDPCAKRHPLVHLDYPTEAVSPVFQSICES